MDERGKEVTSEQFADLIADAGETVSAYSNISVHIGCRLVSVQLLYLLLKHTLRYLIFC